MHFRNDGAIKTHLHVSPICFAKEGPLKFEGGPHSTKMTISKDEQHAGIPVIILRNEAPRNKRARRHKL